MTKKQVRKTATKPVHKVLPLNKENAKVFADLIFSDAGGQVSFLKLCDCTLMNGKDGGRALHCAIGEAYSRFVGNDIEAFKRFIKLDADVNMAGTYSAIEQIVQNALLKNGERATRSALVRALKACMNGNDGAGGITDTDEFCNRSQAVATIWRNRVVPLLK